MKKRTTITEEPEDLGLVVKSKEYALWKRTSEIQEKRIEELSDELLITKEICELAKRKMIELDD